MKHKMLAGLAITAALVTGGTIAAVPAHAANPIRQPCLVSADQCMNNWGGVESNANPVNFWVSGNTFNDWEQIDLGTVVGSNCSGPGQPACWPFPTGSGMNGSFNGETVYTFKWYVAAKGISSIYCLDSGNFNSGTGTGNMKIWRCNGSGPGGTGNINQMFVYDQPNNAQKRLLVSVGASTVGYDNRTHWPSWLGAGSQGSGDGKPVTVSDFPVFAGTWQFEGQA